MAQDATSVNASTAEDGIIDEATFYRSAEDGWAGILKYFPGNLLTEIVRGDITNLLGAAKALFQYVAAAAGVGAPVTPQLLIDFICEDNGVNAGARAAALSSLYITFTIGAGKQASDYEGDRYETVASPDGNFSYIVDTLTHKIVAIEDTLLGTGQGYSEAFLE